MSFLRRATMGKLVTILGACLVAAGGATYGLFTGHESECAVNPLDCPVAEMKCCATPTLSAGDETSPALAAAGPVGLFATVPVKATACSAKAGVSFGCCEYVPDDHGLEAVAGSTAALARK
jgi:hypothetical protein